MRVSGGILILMAVLMAAPVKSALHTAPVP